MSDRQDAFVKRNSYSLPYREEDIRKLWKEARKEALEDVLKLQNGEVINGVIKGMVDPDRIKELLDEIDS